MTAPGREPCRYTLLRCHVYMIPLKWYRLSSHLVGRTYRKFIPRRGRSKRRRRRGRGHERWTAANPTDLAQSMTCGSAKDRRHARPALVSCQPSAGPRAGSSQRPPLPMARPAGFVSPSSVWTSLRIDHAISVEPLLTHWRGSEKWIETGVRCYRLRLFTSPSRLKATTTGPELSTTEVQILLKFII